ncbi:hypothetical protein PRK78_000766 [Emydomyces testavorans]|uniref:Uncharacterized protein n=1 Tax=Emydomyces testavorans TaxID=2070801 RepID=A0AAF0DB98_9EURO|nr:hypothetical protein PRK78_000766 [Emydomyces testavorans]
MPGGFHPPPKVVASWPTPNYVNPTERGPGVVIIASIFSALSLTIAGLRLWVRFKVQREPGLDDYIISVALSARCTAGIDISGTFRLKILSRSKG